ncbi:MAG: hypothetical protein AAF604_16215 [Acidobacteriota bacterium]
MADLGTTAPYYAARPRLFVDGEEVTGLEQGLIALCVEETTSGLFSCEATFGNWGSRGEDLDYLYFDRERFDFGKPLAVVMGDGDAEAAIFEGRITALEGKYPRGRSPELRVLAEDRCQDLRMVRRTRTFEDVGDGDVFERIAGDHGLRPEIDVDGPTYRTLAQVNQSDLAFLRDRARAIDAEVWVEGDALFAQARSRRRAGADVTLTYGEGLRELCLSADLAHQRTRLAVGGWDIGAKAGIEEEVAEEAISGELAGGSSGIQVLSDSFGDRPERLVHSVPLSSEEARAIAESQMRATARRFVSGHGVAEGDARLKVATHVEVAGLGPLFDGAYYVCAVRHQFGPQGFRSTFEVERPALGRAA